MHIKGMIQAGTGTTKPAAPGADEKRALLFIGNQWVNTIYTGYGVVKQRILLQVLQSFQENIKRVMHGRRVEIHRGQDVGIDIDMSLVSHYNNYHQVREQIQEMCSQQVEIYTDPTFKTDMYEPAPLLQSWERTGERKIVKVWIKGSVVQWLLHVNYKNAKASQYTKFDPFTIQQSSTKYMHPLYTMICSYAEKGGFTITIDELRRRMQGSEKYKGFDNFHRFVLKHVQKELQIFGAYGFNFSLVKVGKVVKKVVFKIFANKKYDPNHVWLRIQRALTQELPYFMRFTEQEQEQFNYLLTGRYDLDEVYTKLQHIHKALVRRKEAGDAAKKPFYYTLAALHEQFPPG